MRTSPRKASFRVRMAFSHKVLLVSEDPGFIVELETMMRGRGFEVLGCLGPAHTHCDLVDDHTDCPLAADAFVAIIDSPPSGAFEYQWKAEPAGLYAEKLAARHPDCFVVLCGAPLSLSGPTGEVAHVPDRVAAIQLMEWLAASYGIATSDEASKQVNGERSQG
jgi:hypothetical protein